MKSEESGLERWRGHRGVREIVARLHRGVSPLARSGAEHDRAFYDQIRSALEALTEAELSSPGDDGDESSVEALLEDVGRFSKEIGITLDATQPDGAIVLRLWREIVIVLERYGVLSLRYHPMDGGKRRPVQILAWDESMRRCTLTQLLGIEANRSM